MQETRQNKIARLLQKELSVIFQEQTRAMHGVMVSVTRVKISPDLSICTAYLSIFPSEKGEELLQVVALRRIGRRLGCEKIMLKQGQMILYYPTNTMSPYFQSRTFEKMLNFNPDTNKPNGMLKFGAVSKSSNASSLNWGVNLYVGTAGAAMGANGRVTVDDVFSGVRSLG